MAKKEVRFYSIDAKSFGDEEEHIFKEAIRFVGGHIYNDPLAKGTDTYGFIVSKEKLTKKEIRKISKI
jgi:hypothetical protein